MIIDVLSGAEQYYGLHPLFKEAFEYFEKYKESLTLGKCEIIPGSLYVILAEGKLRPSQEAFLEAHDDFIDIQIVLTNCETYGWRSRQSCSCERSEYDIQNDIIFYNDKPSTYFTLQNGEFAIFFPDDAHAPLVGDGDVLKVIFKCKKLI